MKQLSTTTILLVLASVALSCGRVPAPSDLTADPKAQQRTHLCLAWQFGTPRQTLTDAVRGGEEQKLLAEFLSPPPRADDPDELKASLTVLHDGAHRLRTGADGASVLAESEGALTTIDRFYEATCPAIIAAERATSTTVP